MLENIYKETKEKMEKSIHFLIEELKGIRTGKAHPGLVENIQVDYYGSHLPLKQVASISAPEARLIVIQPWDKNALLPIEKAILSSNLGVNPTNDGKVIRLNLPQLTEEQRKNLSKLVHKKGEETRVAIRNIRHDVIARLEKLEEQEHLSEDDVERGRKEVQKITDEYIKKVDEIIAKKDKEIMEV